MFPEQIGEVALTEALGMALTTTSWEAEFVQLLAFVPVTVYVVLVVGLTTILEVVKLPPQL